MAERFQKPQPGSLPDIKYFSKFVVASPNGVNTLNPIKYWAVRLHDYWSKNDIIAKEFPEDGLNDIYLFWHHFEKTENHVTRLIESTKGTHIPSLELKQAKALAERKGELIGNISGNIKTFVSADKPDWRLAEDAVSWINQYNEEHDGAMEEQVTALCEAIEIVGSEKPIDPTLMRQSIAQHALTEIFEEGAPYSAFYSETEYEDPTSMVDTLETEKEELTSAIRKGVWNKSTLKKKEKQYTALLEALYTHHGYYADSDLIKAFKKLWSCASGDVPKRTSAIKILELQEEVYQALKQDGVFAIGETES